MTAILTARSAVLQALAIPACGIELIERLHRTSEGRLRVSMGSVYPALSRLEAEGLVRSRIVRARGGVGRPRRYYELTLAGVAASGSERRALARLIGKDGHRPAVEPAEVIGERLRRCSAVSASALDLRRRVLDRHRAR